MNTTRLTVAAALLCALPLSACGGGTVNVGPAGAQVSGAGVQVSAGADGAVVSDGQGNQVSAGADGSAGVTASDGTTARAAAGTDAGATAGAGAEAGVTAGAGGVGVNAGGAKVSAGADGVSIDAGGVKVSAGAGGVSVDTGTSGGSAGTRQGTFGVSGQLALSGGATWAGTVGKATCDVNGDQRTITAKTPTGLTVVIDTNGPEMVTLTVSGGGKEWTADDASVVTLTSGRTLVSGAQLAGDGANVRLQANFPC